jgi:hypothetical protein
MMKALLLSLLLTVVAVAQNQPSKATGAQSDPAKNAKSAEITIQGCVNGGQRYTLQQAGTGAMFAMMGDSSRFAPFQGKVAEVHASELPPDQQAASGQLPQLEVNAIRLVADKCPEQPKSNPGAASTGPAYGGVPAQKPAPAVSTRPYRSPNAENSVPPSGGQNPNISGATGAPSPGTGSTPQQPPPQR